jgi:crotonobetainyl-CoA:carnitine CoA-transferase CaiB-like acyl-CoA transferase
VADFGHKLSGPLLGMVLADHGAEVVHVSRPGAVAPDDVTAAILQRGKGCIELDLKASAASERARRLIAGADVVVENFRPGVMARLGLGFEGVRAANASLVYCSLPGFRAASPEAGLPGWEEMVAAVAGTALSLDRLDRSLHRFTQTVEGRMPIASVYSALLGAVCVVAELTSPSRRAVHLEVAGMNALLTAAGYQALDFAPSRPEAELRAPAGGRFEWHGLHACADGRSVFFHVGSKFADRFMAEAAAIGGIQPGSDRASIADVFALHPAAYWEALGDELGAEVSVCRTNREWIDEPHAREAELIVDVDDPVLGAVTQSGTPVKVLSRPRDLPSPRRPIAPDELDALIRRWAAASNAGARTTEGDAALPLAGVKVLDLTVLIAGPTCARVLADLGATVTRVDGPDGVPVPQSTADNIAFELDVNRDKRRIALDLKRPADRQRFIDLVRDADVLVENFRTGVADDLGISFRALQAINPRLVYTSLTMLGSQGRWRSRPGHDFVAQAMTGMAVANGDGVSAPRVQNVRAINDYASGILGALASVLGLRESRRTGRGIHLSTSLSEASTLMQISRLWRTGTRNGWDHDAAGSPARILSVDDGWVAAAPVVPPTESAWLGIAERVATMPAATAERELAASGITARKLRHIDEVTARDDLRSYGAVVVTDLPPNGLVTRIGGVTRTARTEEAITAHDHQNDSQHSQHKVDSIKGD